MNQWKLGTNLRLKFLVMGLWLVLMALGLRLIGTTASGAMLANLDIRQLYTLASECLSAQRVTAETAAEALPQPEKPPDSPKIVPTAAPIVVSEPILPTQLPFTSEEADAIAICATTQSEVDKASLLLAPLELAPVSGPQVLIVHSHTTEAYTQEPDWEYEASGEYRTRDAAQNMIRVGDAVAEELERCGIGVIHDTAINDEPQYQEAYERSYDRIEAQLEAHPSLRIVLDIHRDALEDDEGNTLARKTLIDGEPCAQLMLVVGTDEGGLYHPNWEENLSFALKLQALMNRSYPTLCRDLSLRKERFNQQFTPCSVLVEVGAAGNTLPQAMKAAQYLGHTLAQLIQMAK